MSEVLSSPTVIVFLLISPFTSVYVFAAAAAAKSLQSFMYLGAPIWVPLC